MRTWTVIALLLITGLAGCASTEPATETRHPLAGSTFTWSPAFPEVGETVTFEAQPRTSAAGDELIGILWDFGSKTVDGWTPQHVFSAEGEQSIAMQVQSTKAGSHIIRQTITILPGETVADTPAEPPEPEPSAPGGVEERDLSLTLLKDLNGTVATLSYEWEPTADLVFWDLGDGTTSQDPVVVKEYAAGTFEVLLRVMNGTITKTATTTITVAANMTGFVPHVVVGVPDSGFNVYHEIYRRPHLIHHPCTYVLGYPCDIPALELTFDAPSFSAAVAADREKWEAIRPGDQFWIPGTNIIGAICDQPYGGSTATQTSAPEVDYCILDDSSMHGTGSSSSVLTENPDALLVVVEGNSGGASWLTDGSLPIDVVNFSWGAAVPLVGLYILQDDFAPFYVAASGNEGAFPVVADSTKSHPSVINVGGADGATRTEPGYSSWKTADFVSEYCRPTADTKTMTGMRQRYCGTSFAAPTFAGALSKIILELREMSGYQGTIQNGMVDPILGISKWQVREALNKTATYEATGPFAPDSEFVPLVEAAPYYQYGWGYVARDQVPAAMACILESLCPTKSIDATAYMDALWTYRTTTAWG